MSQVEAIVADKPADGRKRDGRKSGTRNAPRLLIDMRYVMKTEKAAENETAIRRQLREMKVTDFKGFLRQYQEMDERWTKERRAIEERQQQAALEQAKAAGKERQERAKAAEAAGPDEGTDAAIRAIRTLLDQRPWEVERERDEALRALPDAKGDAAKEAVLPV